MEPDEGEWAGGRAQAQCNQTILCLVALKNTRDRHESSWEEGRTALAAGRWAGVCDG